MVIAFQSLPPDAPFSDVIDELQSPGGFEILGFRPRFHSDGTAVKNHTADHVLKEVPGPAAFFRTLLELMNH